MLTELHIENLGVIEQASLMFDHGLTALTGETGAGKTMLVEAIDLLVGGRADSTVVRHGATEARIDGRVMLPGPDGPVETVLTRVVPADGRSRAYVDGRPATVGRLAELTGDVIDLHGQHAHQSLLSTATQRAALDAFGDVDLQPLIAARQHLTGVEAELATLGGDERARAHEIDLLRFQVAELDAAELDDPDEDDRLAAEESALANAVAHREAGLAALAGLRDDDGVSDGLSAAIRELHDREPFAELAGRLAGVSAELDDVVAGLRDLSETIDEDPERLAEIRERRQTLTDLRRKYGDTVADVLDFHRHTAERLRELERFDERAAELDLARAEAAAAVDRAAHRVGAARRAAAPELAGLVQERLAELAMPNAVVEVSFDRADTDDPAADHVAFQLAANPGAPPLPLTRVASGGELARTMLALRLVLGRNHRDGGVTTLVFDEVDAGIGGAAATAVADALARLGRDHRVLVVTHLPQVAAAADQQLVVAKHTDGATTTTSVAPVDDEQRVAEIARMLSGDTTAAALDHAETLLAR